MKLNSSVSEYPTSQSNICLLHRLCPFLFCSTLEDIHKEIDSALTENIQSVDMDAVLKEINTPKRINFNEDDTEKVQLLLTAMDVDEE